MERNLDLLKAFADSTRLRLLHLMANRGPEICVCDLVEVLKIPQSTISRQMAPLRMLGLVQGRRVGTWVLYSLTEPSGEFHRKLVDCLGHCCEGDSRLEEDVNRFDALKKKQALVCCGSRISETA